MERDTVDYSLYYVTGRGSLGISDFLAHLEETLSSKAVGILQLREKNISTRDFIALAQGAKTICDRYNVPLLINDRLDIALAVGAGLHVGQSDMPAKLVRKLLGDKVIIGVSTNVPEDLHAVMEEGVADYVGIGPVHFTASKDVLSPILGARGIREMLGVLGHSKVKAVAIGGISESTIGNLLRQSPALLDDGTYRHLDGVAVISVISASPEPKQVALRLLDAVVAGRSLYTHSSLFTPSPTFSSREVILDAVVALLATLRSRSSPHVIHHITNNVVPNDSANLTLALGCSPIMSGSAEEGEELGEIIGALLINFGTINEQQSKAMLVASKAAVQNRRPIVFDPVGVGATQYRKKGANQLMNDVHFDIIKGNAGEIGALIGSEEVKARGVDSVGDGFANPGQVVKDLARREKLVVAVSGKVDYVSDGTSIVSISNGHSYQGLITGSGCMASGSIAAFASVASGNNFLATIAGLVCYNVAAEVAAARADVKGPNTFRAALIDDVYNLTETDLRKLARFTLV